MEKKRWTRKLTHIDTPQNWDHVRPTEQKLPYPQLTSTYQGNYTEQFSVNIVRGHCKNSKKTM